MDDLENVNNNIDYTMQIKKIREEVMERFKEYEKTMIYMACDVPLEVLCLPKDIEKPLLRSGCLRVCDIFDRDFVEIKGLNDARIRNLTASLDKFFAMF